MVAGAVRDVAPRSAVTRLAWGLCLLAVLLAVAALSLASVNGLDLPELIANHHAIGIMDALVLAPIGALIVVGDRRHLLAWLLLADGLVLAVLNVAEQYAPLALGLTPRRLSLPGGELASWVASWAFVHRHRRGVPGAAVPGRAAAVAPLVAARSGRGRGPGHADGRPGRRHLAAAGAGTGHPGRRGTGPCHRRVRDHAHDGAGAGAISVVALVLRFRRAGAVQRQQIKWFAYLAAPSVPLGMFAQVPPYGPYLEFLGRPCSWPGWASASSASGCGTSTG
jgi:hypothetical protein